ncbi:MAG: protein kinase [Planctomycetota bacterium]|nr:protein kinase [Planctomycetota bacterium]
MNLELPARYETVKFLGKGGMGQVVLARDSILNRPLAIKTLLPRADESLRKRFLEEAQINSQLNHPNIVSVHEIGQSGTALYLVLELIDGKDLKGHLDQLRADPRYREQLTLRKRLRLFVQICDALSYAGRCGVVHRDLKPANVMVGGAEEQRVLVMDWGLAKAQGTCTDSEIRSTARESGEDALTTEFGIIMGTPAYMSPEQALNTSEVDHRSDVYALGAILYELVALAPPYKGPATQVVRSLLKNAPKSVTEVSVEGELPPALVAIIEAAMDRDLEERTQDAGHLARQVRDFLGQRPVDVYQEALGERISRLKSRYRAFLTALALAALLLTISLILTLAQLNRNMVDVEQTVERARAAENDAKFAKTQVTLAAQLTAQTKALSESASKVSRFLQLSIQAVELDLIRDLWLKLKGELQNQSQRTAQLAQDMSEPSKELNEQKEQLASLVSRNNALRQQVDRAMADTFLSRGPQEFLNNRESFDLESELSLYSARAFLRLGENVQCAKIDHVESESTVGASNARQELIHCLATYSTADNQLKLVNVALDQLRSRPEDFGLNSELAWLLGRRAEILVRLGRQEDAALDFKKSLSLRPLDMWFQLSSLEAFNSPYTRAYVLNLVFDFDGSLSQGLWRKTEIFNRLVFEFPKTLAETIAPALNENSEVTLPVLTLALHRSTRYRRSPFAYFIAKELLEIDPNHPEALAALADCTWTPGENREANLNGSLQRVLRELEQYKKKVAKRQAKDPKILLEKNDPLMRQVRAHKLVAQLIQRAIELDKSRPELSPTARRTEANRLLDQGLKRAPDNSALHGVRGRMALEISDLDRAIPSLAIECRAAIWPNPYKRYAAACLKRGKKQDLERALKAARQALCLDGIAWFPRYKAHKEHVHGDPQIHKLIAEIRLAQGQFGKALLHSARGEVQSTRLFNTERGKLAKEKNAYEKAKKNKKSKASVLAALERRHNRQEKLYLEQNKRLGGHRMVLAQCFSKLGMTDEAAEIYRKIQLAKFPQSEAAKIALAKLKR